MKRIQMKLEERFEAIRTAYFPRWDRNREWTAVAGHRTRKPNKGDGYCDTDRKIVWINPGIVDAGETGLDLVIIHEICHATASDSHGKVWRNYMRTKSTRAKKLGQSSIAAMIDEEIANYEMWKGEKPYDRVEGILLDAPDVRYSDLLDYFASEYALDPEEVEMQYPRLRRVFDKAQKEAQEMHRLREEMKKRLGR